MDRVVLYDQKRLKLLRRARLFNWVPFVEKVFLAGSMALGHVHENSDFDVIVVTAPGRLYTARFFCLLLFGLAGWRRTLTNPKDGFCFNHFVINDRSLMEPFGEYGAQLKKNLEEIFTRPSASIKAAWLIEPLVKRLQIYRIEKFLKKFPTHINSRIVYNNERVELCLNLKKW